MDSMQTAQSPHRLALVHMESAWTLCSLCGVHKDPWGSVNYWGEVVEVVGLSNQKCGRGRWGQKTEMVPQSLFQVWDSGVGHQVEVGEVEKLVVAVSTQKHTEGGGGLGPKPKTEPLGLLFKLFGVGKSGVEVVGVCKGGVDCGSPPKTKLSRFSFGE
jgi:hypothetical protein